MSVLTRYNCIGRKGLFYKQSLFRLTWQPEKVTLRLFMFAILALNKCHEVMMIET